MYADLLGLYGIDLVDVVAGTTHHTPRLLIGLLSELPEESALTAAMRGGREWRGWTKQTAVLADVYDAIGRLTQAAGRWRRKPPKAAFKPYPRPKSRRRPVTVADIKRRFLR